VYSAYVSISPALSASCARSVPPRPSFRSTLNPACSRRSAYISPRRNASVKFFEPIRIVGRSAAGAPTAADPASARSAKITARRVRRRRGRMVGPP
jgi:hypothetical protein